MLVSITLTSDFHRNKEIKCTFDVIPNLGEEVYIGSTKYIVTYRAFDILNDSKLVFSGLVLTDTTK